MRGISIPKNMYVQLILSADESCVKLPLRGVWIRPQGESAAVKPPPGKRSLPRTPRSGNFYQVVSADRGGLKIPVEIDGNAK
jgi:hypothetical protein